MEKEQKATKMSNNLPLMCHLCEPISSIWVKIIQMLDGKLRHRFLDVIELETSLKWLTVAMPYQRETREKLERYGAMEDGLSQSNKIAGENQRQQEERVLEIARDSQRQLEGVREEIWSYLDNLMTNGQTNKRTYRAIP